MKKGGYLKSHIGPCDRCNGTGFVDKYFRKIYQNKVYSNRYNKKDGMEDLDRVEAV